jgi:homoserine acetyltransferase/lysophospholipase L1-like esterase
MIKSAFIGLCLCSSVIGATGQNIQNDRQQLASLGDFKLENGAVIKDCKIGYRTYGQPNSAKTNGILFPSWYGGNSKVIEQVVKPWKAVDTSKYFLIVVDALGDGVTSSPSNSVKQHGADFPAFSIRDMVESQYQLLTTQFGITHLHAVMGISMGGFQAFQWAVSHPGFMSHIIPIVATPQPSSYDLVEWTIMRRIIETDTAFHNGRYTVNPVIATGTMYTQLNSTTPPNIIKTLPRAGVEGYMRYTQTAKVNDWNDTWYQLKALIAHDIAKTYNGSLAEAAKQVKAKMTIIVEKQDHLCNPQPATEFSKLLPARLIVLNGESGHADAGNFDDPALVKGIEDELSDVQATGVTNQNLFDTIPFIPEHTPQRLAQFAKEPIVPGKIIFLGNSITEMGNWKKVLNDSTVINRGIGGDISYGVLKRLGDITDRNPSKVFILLGINDIGKDIPEVVIADNYLKIVREIHNKCPQTRIYVQSVLPVNPTMPRFPQHYDKGEHVLVLNELLKAHAVDGGYTFVDIFHLFADADGHLMSQYSYEGLHLKPPAYEVWVDYLKKQGYL